MAGFLARVPEEKRAEATESLKKAFEEVKDVDPKKLGAELGKRLKEIEKTFCAPKEAKPAQPAEILPSLEGTHLGRLAEKDRQNAARLKKAGILDEEAEKLLNYYAGLEGTHARISGGLASAAGHLKEGGDPVSSYTSLKGTFFELSRRDIVTRMLGRDIAAWSGERAAYEVAYDAVKRQKRDGKNVLVSISTKSTVDNDVPTTDGHIHEVKSFPRRTAGQGSDQLWKFLHNKTGEVPDARRPRTHD